MSHRRRRRLGISLLLALGVSLALSVLLLAGFLSTAVLASTDFLFKVQSRATSRSTVIVAIDRRSVDALTPTLGPFNEWSRSIYAQALDELMRSQPRVVLFDIFFDGSKAGDADLAAALTRAGNVVLPVAAERPGMRDGSPMFEVLAGSPAELRDAASGEGLVNITTDPDSVVRSLPLILRVGDAEDVPSLPLVASARYARRPRVIDAPAEADSVYAAGRAIPVIQGNRLIINFLGPPSIAAGGGPFDVVSLVDVLNGTTDPARFQDRIVAIGITLPGVDEYATPSTSQSRMWGVEVLSNAIETILRQQFLTPAPQVLTVVLMVGFALVVGLLVAVAPSWLAAIGALALGVMYLLVAIAAVDYGLLLNLIYPLLALALAFATTLAYRVLSEQAEQRMLRDTMGTYLSPAVSRWVLHDPGRLHLGGETRTMTVLFSDVRGFTTLSETIDPQALVSLLNEYMTAMTEVVFRHDGVLDKYVGDAVMAFWNAPADQPDHARQACTAALDMVDRLGELQTDWRKRGIPALDIGIGINTGEMVVGNMGSTRRMAYTVIGDTVNVASRLEGLTRVYDTHTVISEATREAAGDAFVYRFLDVVAVKGRAEPVTVYEILSRNGSVLR